MRIIAISGKADAGKNTVAKMLQDLDPKYTITAFGDRLKEVCAYLTGIPLSRWNDRTFKEQYQDTLGCSGRTYMVRLGQALRGTDDHVLVKALFANLSIQQNYIIADARLMTEVEAIKHYGGVVIRVERPDPETGNDATEVSLDTYPCFDYTIQNTGSLTDLFYKVLGVYESISAEPLKQAATLRPIQIL